MELSMKMKPYEFGPTRSIRVRWTLQELGVDFEPVRVNLLNLKRMVTAAITLDTTVSIYGVYRQNP